MPLSPEQIPTPKDLQERFAAPEQVESEQLGQVLDFPEHAMQLPAVEPIGQNGTVARRGASRPQGPPERQSVNPVMSAPESQPVELPDAAKPTVLTRSRGGASRPQGPPETSAATTENKSKRGQLELADLVTVDGKGTAHRPDGKFLSSYEREQIEAHEEQIRKGLGQLAAERGLGQIDNNGRAHRENGQLMSNKELAKLLGENKYIRTEQTDEEIAVNAEELDEIIGQDSQAAEVVEAAGAQIDSGPASSEAVSEAEEPVFEQSSQEDSEAATRLTLKARLARRLKQAARHLYLAPQYARDAMRKTGDYLADEEKGRRRGIVAGVIGVAAVGGAYMAYKYGGDLLQDTPDVQPKGNGGADPNAGLADLLDGRGKATPDQSVADALNGQGGGQEAVPMSLNLEQGDSIWADISQRAAQNGHNLSDAQLHELTDQTLKANGLSWEEARHLPVGYQYNIPPEVLAELQK